MKYQMVKLSNGEDIICKVENELDSTLQISSPLKMETYSRTTSKGLVESLGLSRWVQPYSDEKKFTIQKTTVVLMTPVSVGLQKYYEYVIENMGVMREKISEPTDKELKVIEREEKSIEDIADEIEEMSAILEKSKNTIH
jgi:vacuolar-type H+-ATPase subunit I/STV1